MSKRIPRAILLPLILSASIIALDQTTKFLIARFVESYYVSGYTIPVIGDFLRIVYVSNTAIAFSIGRNLPEAIKTALFIALPCVLMSGIIWYYLKASLPNIQRWALAGMIGGGIGNITDRIFRPNGVVDFIDVKMYGIFGFERWPTFNIADSSIVVGAIVLITTTFLFTYQEQRASKSKQAADESEEEAYHGGE